MQKVATIGYKIAKLCLEMQQTRYMQASATPNDINCANIDSPKEDDAILKALYTLHNHEYNK